MSTVAVHAANANYDVRIEPGILDRAGELLRPMISGSKAAIITESNVGPLYAKKLANSLSQAGIQPIVAAIPAGELNKSLTTLLPVYEQLLQQRIERFTPVLALGGGVVGDMAGFVAATILRGVPFVQIPTSLLAMVDASVGGKVGVDAEAGKNLIGAFYQPIAVLADPMALVTLPSAEMCGGLAECIKHDIIRDAAGFESLEKNILRALAGDTPYLTDLIAHNVAIKARVVAADPFEKGERAHLNLGHTFGHAIELVSNFTVTHGQAVALGVVAAAHLAEQLRMLLSSDRQRIVSLLQKVNLPIGGIKLDTDAILRAMALDKKVRDGKVRIILPDGIGKATVRDDIPPEMLRRAIKSISAA